MLCYSEEGSSRHPVEETLLDNFQDLLMTLEDERVTGYEEVLAWDEGEDSAGNLEENTDERDEYQISDLTPAGVLGWLTGQRHVPVNGEKLKITVNFDHECMVRNETHKVCFPIVGACGRVITFPVAHMKDSEDFKRIFLLAYCKGQAFAKR